MGITRGGVVLDGHGDEITVLTCCYRGDAECLGTQTRVWGRAVVSGRRRWLTVGVVTTVLERVGEVDVVLGYVGRGHAEALWDLGRRGQVHGLLAACRGLGCPHVAVVDVSLEVTLGQVGALASRHNTAHVEGTPLALLDALNRIRAVIQGETRAHLLSFLLMEQRTVVAEDMFARNHSSIQLNGEATFITEVNWNFIPFPDKI